MFLKPMLKTAGTKRRSQVTIHPKAYPIKPCHAEMHKMSPGAWITLLTGMAYAL